MRRTISIVLILFILVFGVYFFGYENKITESRNILSEVKEETKINKIKILAIGDSLTAGYGLRLDESYPKILERKLLESNLNVEVINAGVSGETTAGLLERIEFIKKQNPEIVLITIGGNDALRGLPVSETRKNIREIISSLKENLQSSKIFLTQIQAPANLGFAYIRDFNNVYEEIAKQEKINLVPFVVPEVFTKSNLMQNDGIHPNTAGYEYLVDKFILERVKQSLKN